MKKHRDSDEEFIHPFTLPLGEWSSVDAPADGEPISIPVYVLNESGERLHKFAHRSPYPWANDPDRHQQERLLEALDRGMPDDPVDGETQPLTRGLFATVRANRFNEGVIAAHALALARIGNELRRRMGQDRPSPYFVRVVDGRIEAASTARLPFEPPPWAMPYREELRAALKAMKPKPGHLLSATYTAPGEPEFVDTENVVFYNVGVGAFSWVRFCPAIQPASRE